MGPELWGVIIVVAVIAALAGFAAGRLSAPTERRVQALESERDAAMKEAEQVRSEVGRHFEESARMFGRLAKDYRAFFQHFAQTAQNLGLSEVRARELLEQANPNLVSADEKRPGAQVGDSAAGAAGSDAAARAEAAEPETTTGAPEAPEPAGATPEPEPEPRSGTGTAEEDEEAARARAAAAATTTAATADADAEAGRPASGAQGETERDADEPGDARGEPGRART